MASVKEPTSGKSEVGNRLHNCDVCGKHFPFKLVLDMHKKDHIFKNVFKCSKCESSYPKRSQLEMHMRKHTGEKPFKCIDCGSAFINSSNLRRHKRKHLCRRSYDKDEWEAAFALSGSLHNEKQPSITTDSKFSCQQCNEVFTCLLDVIVHKRKHSDVTNKPFACELCNLTFSVKASLNYHKLKHSSTDTNFWHNFCDICEEAFTSKDGLIQHQRKHSGTQTFSYDKNLSAFSAPIQSVAPSNLNIVYPNVSHEMYPHINEQLQGGFHPNHLFPQFTELHPSLVSTSQFKNSETSNFQQVSFTSHNISPLLHHFSEGANLNSNLIHSHLSCAPFINTNHPISFQNNSCMPSNSEEGYCSRKSGDIHVESLTLGKQTVVSENPNVLQPSSISENIGNKCLPTECKVSDCTGRDSNSSTLLDYIGRSNSNTINDTIAIENNHLNQDSVVIPNSSNSLTKTDHDGPVKDLSMKK